MALNRLFARFLLLGGRLVVELHFAGKIGCSEAGSNARPRWRKGFSRPAVTGSYLSNAVDHFQFLMSRLSLVRIAADVEIF